MRENHIFFPSADGMLEGLFSPHTGTRGAVIVHPHPFMGGTMRDGVVMLLDDLFQRKGFSTLRFNFRGVGMSEGHFDEGIGEVDDLQAAVTFFSAEGVTDLYLAGYSFGALIAGKYLSRDPAANYTLLVSPPLNDLRAHLSGMKGKKGLIVSGDMDFFCPVDELKGLADSVAWDMDVVPGADHFYLGRELELIRIIEQRIPGRGAGWSLSSGFQSGREN